MHAQITKLHHRLHEEQGEHSISYLLLGINKVARDINLLHDSAKLRVKLLIALFIQGKNISRKLCIHENILP